MEIKIGPIKYTIVKVPGLRASNDRKLFGEVIHEDCEIRVKTGQNCQQERQTVWHEIMHIAFEQTGHSEDGSESFITSLSHALMQIVQDNPFLAETP